MYPWAVLLASKKYSRIFCVYANGKEEAFGKAFSELTQILEKEKKDEENSKDYSVVIWAQADSRVSSGSGKSNPSSTGSFDDQIRQLS